MKIKTMFNVIQGHQITDEELYIQMGDIPVLTGKNSIKGFWNKKLINQDDLPCITYPTKGNYGDAFIQTNIFDANNTAVLIPYPKYRTEVNLKWLNYKLPSIFLQIQTSKGGVSYINKEIIEEYDIKIPDTSIQLKELDYFRKLNDLKDNIKKIKLLIDKVNQQSIVDDNPDEEVVLSYLLDYTSRNDALSEEGLYNRSINLTVSGKKITVISGTTEDIYGYVPFDEDLHYLSDKPCLQVITRGINAGTINFLQNGTYATNTNAMLLSIKESKKDELKINNKDKECIYLKYLEIYLRSLFFDYRSSGDHSVFPLTKAVDEISIPLFKYDNKMENIIRKYEKIYNLECLCNNSINKLKELIAKEIIISDIQMKNDKKIKRTKLLQELSLNTDQIFVVDEKYVEEVNKKK